MKLLRWQHGLLSFLILISLIALIIAACIRPALSFYKEKQEELTTLQGRLQKYQAVANQKDTLIPFYEEQISQNRDNQNFLPIMPASLAAAKLQEQIKALLKGTQGQLISTQPVPGQAEGIFTPVMIRVHMKSNIEILLNTIHNLESSRPLTFIDNLQVQRLGSSKKNKHSRLTNRNNKPLDTRFDLKVYMLKEAQGL